MSAAEPAGPSRARRLLLGAGRILLVVLVTWALFRAFGIRFGELDLHELARWRPAPWPLVASTLMVALVYVAHAFLWGDIVTHLTGVRLAASAVIRVYFLAALGRYLPGKIWQLTGIAVLGEREGVPGLVAAGASVLGHLAFLITGALLLLGLLPGWAGSTTALVGLVGLAAVGGLAFWLLRGRAGDRLSALLGKRLRVRMEAALDMVRRVRARRALLWAVAYTFTWLVLCAAFVIFVAAFVPESGRHVRHLSGTVAAAYLGGYIALAPAGAGVREGVMGLLLAQVVPTPAAAALIAVASRLWFTLAEVLVLIAVPFLRRRVIAQPGAARP